MSVHPHANIVVALQDRFTLSIYPILPTKEQITAHLKHATELESPRNFAGSREEPEHLHDITGNPTGKD